ncbi:hypothetical protein ANN_02136 [Periplaneta americana]|uniref:Uncharacterized protein n=1 Tax=Periplaneta americana TaxID=6978 RepID=A0ABQ8TYE7_PERAM|nr:hypothetical protein ANN_02136 [Periplaneta americana]
MQWYADNNVHRLDWPAQSPDLNPIEHLWDELDRRLRSREMRPTSIVQLSAMLQEEWRFIPVDILHKLVETMPDRVAAVIATRVEQVDSFQYLGRTISSNMSCCQEIKRIIAITKETFNRKRSIICESLEKELRKSLVKCFVWSVALYGAETWTLRPSEEKRLEAFEMWIWRRIRRNDAETDQKEEKELPGSLVEKKLPYEGYTGRNVEREKSSKQKKISDDKRQEQRLRVFENKVLRKIFGAKRDEVTGEWRKLHNTELHALYSSPDIIRNIKSRRLRWAGHVARMGEFRNAYRVLVGRPERKSPLGRPRRRWEDNIKMDLREVGYDDRDWIDLAQDRDQWRAYVRAAMNLRVP